MAMSITAAGSCVVIGAGVSGLTSAIVLQRQGWKVTIVAKAVPQNYDAADATYASPKAGAHWHSFASESDTRLQRIEADTFRILSALTKDPDANIMLAPSMIFLTKKPDAWADPWYAKHVPNFRYLDPTELPAGHTFGFTYNTVCISVPRYLAYLVRIFTSNGGTLVQEHVGHIDDVHSRFGPVDIVVHCSALGAATLGGVMDHNVYPIRGQIAVVEGDFGFAACTSEHRDGGEDEAAYVIPRNDGTCILGGTFLEGDSDTCVRKETFERFVDRTAKIHPQVATWRDAYLQGTGRVVAHHVGLRPARRGGLRIESEFRDVDGKQVIVVHNYGHGPYGYQTSWGCALEVSRVLQGALLEQSMSGGKSLGGTLVSESLL